MVIVLPVAVAVAVAAEVVAVVEAGAVVVGRRRRRQRRRERHRQHNQLIRREVLCYTPHTRPDPLEKCYAGSHVVIYIIYVLIDLYVFCVGSINKP